KLKDDRTMSSKDKHKIWDGLSDFIVGELNLAEKSRFILVNANNENDQIENADKLYEHWNDFANGKMKNCIFNMVVLFLFLLIFIAVFFLKKRVWTWYPKGANNPNFQNNLNKEDWDEHLEGLMKMIKISDEECLKDKKEKVLKSGDHLQKIWSDRYGDAQSCYFVLNVVEKETERNDKSGSDNENSTKNQRKTEVNEEEGSRQKEKSENARDYSDNHESDNKDSDNKSDDNKTNDIILDLSSGNTIADISQPIWDAEYKEYDTKIEELEMVLSFGICVHIKSSNDEP
ncbi:hypothetical protein RFI_28193, partial [Reticulomyxa filosa]